MQYHLQKNEYALTLLGLLLLPDSAKSDGGINHRGGGEAKCWDPQHHYFMPRSGSWGRVKPTPWKDLSHRQKEFLSCEISDV
jgi:hypothetical protein